MNFLAAWTRYVFLVSIYLGIALVIGCSTSSSNNTIPLKEGPWRFILDLGGEELRFSSHLSETSTGYFFTMKNASETIQVDEVIRGGDSIMIRMPVFDSEFRGEIMSPTWIRGQWYNYAKGPDYKVDFEAVFGESACEKLKGEVEPSIDVSGKWEVMFSKGMKGEYPAIGVFNQTGSTVTGTFLTETGDYRFLEGLVEGNQLRLSTFDGAHAFLFTAAMLNGKLEGKFQSGTHFQEPWSGSRNPNAKLREPEKLTTLKPGQPMQFTFPNLSGQSVSLNNPRYRDKVVIVQVMGSWCPNCLDESKLFAEWYKKYQPQGLEIIALAFEKVPFDRAVQNLQRLKNKAGINYEILVASNSSDKKNAANVLPMLSEVMSYPTSIYIDQKGKVQRIHTGFNGPGTGVVYKEFREEYEGFIEQLLRGN